ncbi:MAG: hypothetical protein GYA66_07120, partial [Phyllobacteriaceae bacterium]|nr:hypothetical protein [Phyllobacteriaceae bacterium]
MSTTIGYDVPASRGISVEQVRTALVAMIFVSSFYVKMEPAPSEIFFLLALIFCIGGGLRFSAAIMPLFFLLLVYNLSCLFSYALIPYDRLDAKAFLIGLAYTTLSGVFFAAYVADDPVKRYHQIIK